MSYEEFEKRFRKDTSSNLFGNRFAALVIAGVGVFFAYLEIVSGWANKTTPDFFSLIIPILCIGVFLYGWFYKIPSIYKISKFRSNEPIEEKGKIINHLKKELELREVLSEDNYFMFNQKRFWFSPSFEIYLFFDENYFYFNSQLITGVNSIGFIDFGKIENFNKEIIRALLRY